jgi:putative membrane protein
MLLGGIVMLVFWGGLIALTVIAVRAVWNSGSGSGRTSAKPEPDPIEIAQQRYARGEISRDEFLEIKQDLEN